MDITATGKDITISGSSVVADNDVTLKAQENVDITSQEETSSSDYRKKVKKSGRLSGGGLGFTIGKEKQKDTYANQNIEQAGSTIGSIDGNVTIEAGKDVTALASDIIAGQDISLTGENVAIESKDNTYNAQEKHEYKKSGLTVAVGGKTVKAMEKVVAPLERATQVQDERLAAFYGYKAYDELTDENKTTKKDLEGIKDPKHNFSIEVSIGTQKSKSQAESSSTLARESNITAQGDVNITATKEDISIHGSNVSGENVTLKAQENINITASENTNITNQTSKSSQGSIGVSISLEGISGINAGYNKAKGEIKENSTVYNPSNVTAKDTLTLESGKDTNIIGSKVSGDTVKAEVGENLNIESLQTQESYDEKNSSSGLSIDLTPGGKNGIQGSANKGKIQSDYESVTEQAGIYAGEGGFDIEVGGNTDLKGAVIASDATPDKNKISTDTLTYSDIENKAEYKASSTGVAYSSDKGFTPTPGIPTSGDANSTTKSAISPGTIIVGGKEVNPTGLSRDPSGALNALGKIFDKKTVQEKQELAQLFGEEAFKAVGDIAARKVNKANEADEAAEACTQLAVEARKAGKDDLASVLEQNASALTQMSKDIRASWDEGGTMKILLHAVVGGIASDLGGGNSFAGAIGAGASEASRKMLQNLSQEEHRIVSGIIGATAAKIVGGNSNSVQTGAGTAVEGTKNNFEMPHPDELDGKSILKMILAGPEGIDLSDDAVISMLAKAAKDVAFKEAAPGAINVIQGASDYASKIADLPVINKTPAAKMITTADLFIQFPGEIVKSASKNYDVKGYTLDMAVADAFKAKGIETARDLTVDKACDILAEKYKLGDWEKWTLKQTIKKVAEECGIKNQG